MISQLIWQTFKKERERERKLSLLDKLKLCMTSMEGSKKCRTMHGEVVGFSAGVGLHQGSTLNPFLFSLVMDNLISKMKILGVCCLQMMWYNSHARK